MVGEGDITYLIASFDEVRIMGIQMVRDDSGMHCKGWLFGYLH
jgi:hypothetical protein